MVSALAIFIMPIAVGWWANWYPGSEPGGGSYIAQRMLASVATRFSSTNTLALAYAMQRTFGLERTDVVGLTQTVKFASGGSVSVGANHSVNDQKYSSINLSFARALSY